MIPDKLVSRAHVSIEYDPVKGLLYVCDCSTNGTFLNGVRLPSKIKGKVLLSHGDELLLKDPSGPQSEFGYIVNLSFLQPRAETILKASRRRPPEGMGGDDYHKDGM